MGTGQEDQKIKLSELIDILNERFGTNFTQADQLFFDQIQEEAIESEALQKAAATNSKDDFRYVFEKAFEGLVIDRMEGNEEIFSKLIADGEFRKLAVEHILHKVYGAEESWDGRRRGSCITYAGGGQRSDFPQRRHSASR